MIPIRCEADGDDPVLCIECGRTAATVGGGILFKRPLADRDRRAFLCGECAQVLVVNLINAGINAGTKAS